MDTPETLALAATDRLQPSDELLAELRQLSEQFEPASPPQILRWASERFGEKLTMATAFGPEGMVILHWLAGICTKSL